MRSDYLNENSNSTYTHKKKVQTINADITLTNADSGKVFMLDAAGGTVAITLPTASTGEDGVYFKFVVEEETPSNAITIAAGSAIVSFVGLDVSGTAASTVGTQVSNVIIGTSAQKGDVVELMFTKKEYVGTALSGINGAITTS
tara:strand:- start:194 stop:625 length:432 start_codon:yes stop_codon:yes gene_type:complete